MDTTLPGTFISKNTELSSLFRRDGILRTVIRYVAPYLMFSINFQFNLSVCKEKEFELKTSYNRRKMIKFDNTFITEPFYKCPMGFEEIELHSVRIRENISKIYFSTLIEKN